MLVDILSLFPKYFEGPFSESILKRAIQKKLLQIRLTDIRDFSQGPRRRVDDRPYGGGPGMVLMPEPVVKAIRQVRTKKAHVVYLSPRGIPLTAKKCRSLASQEHLVLLCGHYEGIDQRALELEVDEEISIGDYVLTNGCLAAIVLVDAVARFIPGVVGCQESVYQDSFETGMLDWSHYTRPEEFEGMKVPEVLLSGHHEEIAKWRKRAAEAMTKHVRPDLQKGEI